MNLEEKIALRDALLKVVRHPAEGDTSTLHQRLLKIAEKADIPWDMIDYNSTDHILALNIVNTALNYGGCIEKLKKEIEKLQTLNNND